MIDLQPSEDQEEIVRSVTDYLSNELPVARFRSTTATGLAEDHQKWRQIGALGFFGLGLPESLGGSGFGLSEEILVFREFGRFLLSPACVATVLAARTVAHAGDLETASAIIGGEISVGLAAPFHYDIEGPPFSGMFHLIDDRDADLLMTWSAQGSAVIPREAFKNVNTLPCIDWTTSLSRAELAHYTPRQWIARTIDFIPERATLLTAAMLTGIAEAALNDSVEYTKTRHQFGQPLGAFQAVKHRCADMATRAAAAWYQTLFAALVKQNEDRHAPFQIAAAKIVAADAAIRNGAADIQNFGGMGFTGEQNPHLFLKRAHIMDRIGGNSSWHGSQLIGMRPPND